MFSGCNITSMYTSIGLNLPNCTACLLILLSATYTIRGSSLQTSSWLRTSHHPITPAVSLTTRSSSVTCGKHCKRSAYWTRTWSLPIQRTPPHAYLLIPNFPGHTGRPNLPLRILLPRRDRCRQHHQRLRQLHQRLHGSGHRQCEHGRWGEYEEEGASD